MSAAYDPTLPLGAAITFCVYRLFAKRKARAPDGPYWGNSPVWGALGTTLLGLLAGGVVSLPSNSSGLRLMLRAWPRWAVIDTRSYVVACWAHQGCLDCRRCLIGMPQCSYSGSAQ
jgi:hypothetical protein